MFTNITDMEPRTLYFSGYVGETVQLGRFLGYLVNADNRFMKEVSVDFP